MAIELNRGIAKPAYTITITITITITNTITNTYRCNPKSPGRVCN
jgi:hypothetical protein